ncbi:hypothetical protein KUCAC02_004640 [Chaenocephalus aceratus]|uniref:Uncharacterized protein n=1 Tax=Chaenocephalus aceratus TaxID=36190 RepID=A0ACB9WZA0_CHAAC|nr:hypothetical protein KUCAC02_004640 [Chaenocephalus aceratus]
MSACRVLHTVNHTLLHNGNTNTLNGPHVSSRALLSPRVSATQRQFMYHK